jgi:hypothetical protein
MTHRLPNPSVQPVLHSSPLPIMGAAAIDVQQKCTRISVTEAGAWNNRNKRLSHQWRIINMNKFGEQMASHVNL